MTKVKIQMKDILHQLHGFVKAEIADVPFWLHLQMTKELKTTLRGPEIHVDDVQDKVLELLNKLKQTMVCADIDIDP